MAKPKTGTIEPNGVTADGKPRFRARIRLQDGSRPRIPVPDGYSEARAREFAARMQELEDERGALYAKRQRIAKVAHVGETVAVFAGRWIKARTGKIASVRDNEGHLDHHILPVLGHLTMTGVTSMDIERLVDVLDGKVEAGALGAKSARNIWGTCTKLFDDATHAKPAEGLRCLTVDPTDKVRGPDDDDAEKALQFLYPSEFLRFVQCDEVPLTWRRNVAIACYLGLRDGEQRALRWTSVDLEHGTVMVEATYDRRTGKDRAGTKTGAARMVPIPESLAPLLKAMHDEGGEGLVCSMPSLRDMSRGLRRWLLKAGVTRTQLHASTSVSRAMRWHDCRSTALTWMAVRGDAPTTIRDIAGHAQLEQTGRYIRSATMLRGGRFGEVFPPLPGSLVTPEWSTDWSTSASMSLVLQRGGRDSNPRPPA